MNRISAIQALKAITTDRPDDRVYPDGRVRTFGVGFFHEDAVEAVPDPSARAYAIDRLIVSGEVEAQTLHVDGVDRTFYRGTQGV